MSFTVISPKDKRKIRELLGEESTCVFEPTDFQKSLIRMKTFSLTDEPSAQTDPISVVVERPSRKAPVAVTKACETGNVEGDRIASTWVITNLIPKIPKSK